MDLMKIEIIEDNLKLRTISFEDKEDIYREFTDEITKYMYPSTPKDISDTIDFIDSSLATVKAGLNIQLVLEDSKTGEFFGCVGLNRIDKDTPEFGIWLKKAVHGKGYGKKSIKMLYDYANSKFDVKYYIYPVAEENVPSRKIPESLGAIVDSYKKIETQYGKVLNIVEYHILKKLIVTNKKHIKKEQEQNYSMTDKIKAPFANYRQFILFCCVGVANSLITMLVLYLLETKLGINYKIATAIGYICGVANGYLWSTYLVFKEKRTTQNAAKFAMVNAVVFCVNLGLMYLFVDICGLKNVLGLGSLPAQAITICFTMVLNFTLNKFWTFKRRKA